MQQPFADEQLSPQQPAEAFSVLAQASPSFPLQQEAGSLPEQQEAAPLSSLESARAGMQCRACSLEAALVLDAILSQQQHLVSAVGAVFSAGGCWEFVVCAHVEIVTARNKAISLHFIISFSMHECFVARFALEPAFCVHTENGVRRLDRRWFEEAEDQIRRTVVNSDGRVEIFDSCPIATRAFMDGAGSRACTTGLGLCCAEVDGSSGVLCGPGRAQHGCSLPQGTPEGSGGGMVTNGARSGGQQSCV